MKRRVVSGIVLMLLLTSILSSAFMIKPIKAAGGTIYIRVDGSVDPSTAPILNVGNVYYTFTADIHDSIVIERDNIVLDGDGYALQGATGYTLYRGIDLSGRSNVTIKNMLSITGFRYGIFLNYSYRNVLINNSVITNICGIYSISSSLNIIRNNAVGHNPGHRPGVIYLEMSSENTIIGNSILSNTYFSWSTGRIVGYGIQIRDSNLNTLSDNVMSNNGGVFLYNSSNSNIAGNSIGRYGCVWLYYSSNNEMSGNSLTSGGVQLYYSPNNNIARNNITGSSGYGIYLHCSSKNVLSLNNVANSKYGIYLSYSSTNTLYDNLLDGNEFGLIVFGVGVNDYLHSIDTSNLIDGKTIYYLVDQHNLVINPLAYPQIGYLALVSCTNITVENVDLRNHYVGLLIVRTNNSKIFNNNIANSYSSGFLLANSSGNVISGNRVTNTSRSGFDISFSIANRIYGNNITNNGYGIRLYTSDANTFSDNLLVTNRYLAIFLTESSNNVFSENTISNNMGSGIVVISSRDKPVFNTTITNNDIAFNDGFGIITERAGYYYRKTENHTITNNNVKGNIKGGIHLRILYDSTISRNIILDNGGSGICIIDGVGNLASGNIVSNNTGYGVLFSSGYGNTLSDNVVTNNDGYGICLDHSPYNTLSGNIMVDNRYNFGVRGSRRLGREEGLINYVDSSNTVDDKPVYYWIDERDKVVPSDAGYVIIVDSTNITIKDATLARNYAGVFLAFSRNSTIQNVTSTNNYNGIMLVSSQQNLLSGNIIANNEYYGVDLSSSPKNTVIENNVTSNGYGLRLADSYDNIITGNIVAATIEWYGVLLTSSSHNLLSGNNISNNEYYGVYIVSSYNNTLYDNLLNDNRYGLSVLGESLSHYLHFIDDSNLVDGKPIYYYVNKRNMETPLNAGYVALVNCTRMTARSLTLTNNGQGILLAYTNNSRIVSNNIAKNIHGVHFFRSQKNTLSGNIIANNSYGIYLYSSFNNNTVSGNNIANNSLNGIHLRSSYNNLIIENNVTSNVRGIYVDGSSSNNIYHNNFVDNHDQAYSYGSTNVWDDGYPSGGNYWSDYRGVDNYSGPYQNETGTDGIGDRPYGIRSMYGYKDQDRYPLMNPTVPAVIGVSDEKSFIESTFVEALLVQEAVLNNVAVSGDLNGTLTFTSFEIVSITTGPFAGNGFSKGEWEATLEGVSYKGDWRGSLFLKPSERKIYLKGAISGEISGTVEGYLTETVLGSGIYDQYQATWRIGRVCTITTSATINLNGTLTYLSDSEFPATELYVLQTSMEGAIFGHYNCSLSAVLTHVQVVNGTPYDGEGFSIISYTSNLGSGEGWTYDRLASPGTVKMRGLFTNPLFGSVSATLDETILPRSLLIYIERVDLGLPPMADLKIKVCGPGRASSGETISYIIELRNDGLKPAENVTLICLPPFLTDFVSVSFPGNYDDVIHIVRWDFENIPPKTIKYLSIQVKIFWGLPQGTMLTHLANVYPKGTADEITQHTSPRLTEKQKIVLHVILTAAKAPIPYGLGTIFSLVDFLGEASLDLIIMRTRLLAYEAGIDERFEEAAYLSDIGTLLYYLQEDPEYLKKQNKTFCQAVEELAEKHNYTPPKGITQITVARDPNVKYGLEGYVSSGQTLNYTVNYENEGEGIAFGVYFTDTLDEDLDDSTLEICPVISTKDGSVIADPGTYNPSTRTITWLVGEVGPSEGGFATFSVKVRNDAPEDTEIINFATVYFPSVPETTRTNAIVSVVGQPRIAVTNVTPLESVIERGFTLCINVTVANKAYLTETFNLTLYANATAIQTQSVTLTGRSSDTVIFVWNTTGFPSGNYTMSAYAWPIPDEVETEDNLYVNGVVQVEILDYVPPVTVLDLGEPEIVIADIAYLTPYTPITLTAQDDLGGSGVALTSYRIYNTSYDSGWITYMQPFYLIGLSDGTYQIDYNSTDYAGNVEPTNTATVILDNTPPETTITIGEPKYIEAVNTYVTSATPFTLTATDNAGSGVASTAYNIYNATFDIGWTTYMGAFNLPNWLSDGAYNIAYNSTDNLENIEVTKSITVILDNTPPTTSLTIGEPKCVHDVDIYVNSATPFILNATDNTGSGVTLTVYKIYNSTYDSGWITYTGNFSLPTWLDNGPYLIAYNSTDNLGNVETENIVIAILRNPLVDTWMTDSDFNEIESFRVVFTPYRNTELYKLTATNPGQFYLNILVNNTWPEPLNITIVYSIDANFTFKGARPIHVYADLERTIDITANCTFSDNTITVYNVAPNTIIYVTIHLDYASKGTTWTEEDVEAWYSEHAFNATVHPITSEVIIIDPELQIPPIPSYLIFLIVIVPMIILCLGLILLLKYAPLIAARCKED